MQNKVYLWNVVLLPVTFTPHISVRFTFAESSHVFGTLRHCEDRLGTVIIFVLIYYHYEKKLVYCAFALTALVCTSCKEEKTPDVLPENITSNQQTQSVISDNVVIVRVNHGKRVKEGKKYKCEGDQTFRCWRWFPKDQLVNLEDPYEFANYMTMEYMTVEHQTKVVLRVSQYNGITQEPMDLYKYIGTYDGIYIEETMVIDEPVALEFLHVEYPVMILPGYYKAIADQECFIIPLDFAPYN